MSDYRLVIRIVNLLIMTDEHPVTSHKVARETAQTFSRSTCYRRMMKMRKIGLLESVTLSGCRHWRVTEKGERFMEGWQSLGI